MYIYKECIHVALCNMIVLTNYFSVITSDVCN